MTILFVAGDVGGARAILPVARNMANQGMDFTAVAHRTLHEEGSKTWKWVEAGTARQMLEDAPASVDTLIYATSVRDNLSVDLACLAVRNAVPAIHVLDNWSSYAARLRGSGDEIVVPDVYCVMDEQAFDGAVKDGVPEDCLRITGHPNLAWLAAEAKSHQPISNAGKLNILFVSEPAALDSGATRGYDEALVSSLFASGVAVGAARLGKSAVVRVAAHPREDRATVERRWDALAIGTGNETSLSWSMVSREAVRAALHGADLVAGMSSILLYEAWLLGKTVVSLQPGVRIPALRTLADRDGLIFCDDARVAPRDIQIALELASHGETEQRTELVIHQDAAKRITDIAKELIARA